MFPIYLLFIIEPFLFENVGQILKCIFCCITAFKVKKNVVKKNQNMSEVAIGGRGVSKLQKKSEVLGFFNPSLTLMYKSPAMPCWSRSGHQGGLREVKKKKKKKMDGFNPQWGGGVSGLVHFSSFFLTFNVKIMSKNWKRTIKQW